MATVKVATSDVLFAYNESKYGRQQHVKHIQQHRRKNTFVVDLIKSILKYSASVGIDKMQHVTLLLP